jgi:hypothetical protein
MNINYARSEILVSGLVYCFFKQIVDVDVHREGSVMDIHRVLCFFKSTLTFKTSI